MLFQKVELTRGLESAHILLDAHSATGIHLTTATPLLFMLQRDYTNIHSRDLDLVTLNLGYPLVKPMRETNV